MSSAPLSLRILLVATIAFNLVIAVFLYGNSGRRTVDPKAEKLAGEAQLQELISTRKSEHWDFWQTKFPLTLPPSSQPVRTIPEWAPAGTVVVALDEQYGWSFIWNSLLGTTNNGSEIIEEDSARSLLITKCRTIDGPTEEESPEITRRREEFMTLCRDLSDEQLKTWSRGLSFAHTFLRTVSGLSRYTNVLVLVPASSENEVGLKNLALYIKEFPGGQELLANKNLQFAQLPVTTRWVRDYGPIFVQTADSQILLVDSRYDPNRESAEEKRQREIFNRTSKQSPQSSSQDQASKNTEDSEADNSSRLSDDICPSILAMHLRQKDGNVLYPTPISAVRPPIELDGGDFATDGSGMGFTSTETLMKNGGNLELLTQVFRQYFGLTDVIYLQPLPGSTVKHIDMFFKVVSSDTILLGTIESIESAGPESRPLQAEAQRVLNYDLEILKNFYESRGVTANIVRQETDELKRSGTSEKVINIVLVPMPPVERPVQKSLAAVQEEENAVASKYQKIDSKKSKSVADRQEMTDLKMRYEELKAKEGRLTEQFPQGHDIYRTYLNALQVYTSQANILLVPSYKNLDAMETRVHNIFNRVYTRAYGNVTLMGFESDNTIELEGSIHCLTDTIPAGVSVFPDEWNYKSDLTAR